MKYRAVDLKSVGHITTNGKKTICGRSISKEYESDKVTCKLCLRNYKNNELKEWRD